MLQAANTKSKRRNAATQTRDTDNVLEIARLQQQVKLLQIEVDHLRKYNNENLSNTQKSLSFSPTSTDESLMNNEVSDRKTNLENQSLRGRSSKILPRGCNCKGKCSSKICGCVKKDARCGEWCKCNDGICKNQENENVNQNKENLDINELRHKQVENKKIVNEHLAKVKAGKGLFSPDASVLTPTINVEQFSTAPIYFGSPEKLSSVSDEEENAEESIAIRAKTPGGNNKKIIKQKSIRNKKTIIDASNSIQVRTHDAISNEKKLGQPVVRNNEISIKEGKHEEIEKQTSNYTQNIKDDMVSVRRTRKRVNQNDIKKSEGKTNALIANESHNTTQDRKIISLQNVPKPEEIDSSKMQISKADKSLDMNESSDGDFDPMKPKHELPRTPVRSSDDEASHKASNISLPTSVAIRAEPDISAEFNQPEVNWEEYQSQLIACKKCKRKFHPLRIEKHVSCCKRV